MISTVTPLARHRLDYGSILTRYSVELTARDRKSLELAPELLAPNAEVFITSLPNDKVDNVVAACNQLRQGGLTPVPHVTARSIETVKALDSLLGRLVLEAGVDRCLVLGGDRDKPAGELSSSLQILESGLIQKRGMKTIRIGCYPEGHPKIPNNVLDEAYAAKLALAARDGLEVTLVSQFAFEAEPIIAFAKKIRAKGIKVPLRVGVAGPADRGLLLKYALMCGVGNSLRVLRSRTDLAANALAGETPEAIIRGVANAQAEDPSLGICGIHFFAFGSLAKSAQWANAHGAEQRAVAIEGA